jgi:hypothetical protein
LALPSAIFAARSAACKCTRCSGGAAGLGAQLAVSVHEALAQLSRIPHEGFEHGSTADAPLCHLVRRDLVNPHPMLRRKGIALGLSPLQIRKDVLLRFGRRFI